MNSHILKWYERSCGLTPISGRSFFTLSNSPIIPSTEKEFPLKDLLEKQS